MTIRLTHTTYQAYADWYNSLPSCPVSVGDRVRHIFDSENRYTSYGIEGIVTAISRGYDNHFTLNVRFDNGEEMNHHYAWSWEVLEECYDD